MARTKGKGKGAGKNAKKGTSEIPVEAQVASTKPTQWWLILGLVSYLITVISSAVQTIGYGFSNDIYGIIDWFAACIIYFFLGALIGFIVDVIIAKHKGRTVRMHDWSIYIIALWIIGAIVAITLGKPTSVGGFIIYLLFPLSYGIFFPSFAFIALFPKIIYEGFFVKVILDVIYLAIFGMWMWLAIRRERQKETSLTTIIRRTLIAIVFLVLVIGMIGCANQL